MNKSIVLSLSVSLLVLSLLGIFGTQFSTGTNPVDIVMFVLMMTTGASAETITYSTFRNRALRILPLLLSITVAAWGTYLFLTSDSWINATIMDLISDYCSLMVGGIVSIILLQLFPIKS